MDDPTVGLHVGQLLQRVPGGIGRYTSILAEELPARGVPLVPFAAGARPASLTPAAAERYVDLGRPHGRWRYDAWLWLRRPALELDVDVIHAPSLAVPPCGDTPLVVTVHDVAFLRLPQYFTVHGLRFHERGLRLARDEARAVVVPSHFVAAELTEEGFDTARIHVAHHGIDTPRARDQADVDAALARLGVEAPYVLFVGTLEPRKGLETLLRGFAVARRSRRELSLALVGARGWGKLPELDRAGVLRLGSLPDDDLDALYRGAAALAYPSHYEGFGLPVLEAMARGCPAVTSNATSLPEVVGDAGVLVEVDDPEALGQALSRVLDDPADRERLRQAGLERARWFTWDDSIEAHRTAYRAATEA